MTLRKRLMNLPTGAFALTLGLFATPARPQAAAPPQRPPSGGPFVEFKSGPGTRFSVLEAKEAPKETLFAIVPSGFLEDEAGQTQMAHLLEHMLIRSTDRDGLKDGELTFNGETNEVALRLELFAPPELAQAGLKKLLGWLQATTFDPGVLETEKQKVASELDTTCANGFTHKWAYAAWNQVARRGRGHAAVRGDVMAATADQVEEAADSRIDLAKVRIVAVGPAAADSIRSFAQQEFARTRAIGALAGPLADASAKRQAAEAEKRAKKAKPIASGDLSATWDLPNSHLLLWYLLPDATADDAAAALVLSHWIGTRVQADPKITARKPVTLVSADAVVPEGRVLMLSAALPAGTDADALLAAFQATIAGLLAPAAQGAKLDDLLRSVAQEFAAPPDFSMLRRQFGGRPGADLLEAQVALNLAMREQAAGRDYGELSAAMARLTRARLEALVKERLLPAKRSTLKLAPKG